MISDFTTLVITDEGINFDKLFKMLKKAKEDRIVPLIYMDQLTFVVVSKESLNTIKAALTHVVVELEEEKRPVK